PDQDELRKQIEAGLNDRFIKIPRGNSDEAWKDMEHFALALDDEQLKNKLLNTIQGSGAFRRFKDMVFEEGFRQDWFEFRDLRVRRRTLDWLVAKGLVTEQQCEQAMEQLEEDIRQRKQRQQDMQDMQEGSRVVCRRPADSPGLSEGTEYEVIGERPADSLVRVSDDRDRKCWYPKTQFGLIRDE
ncbi:MAG: UPF0158 family protein, partial [bacterium]